MKINGVTSPQHMKQLLQNRVILCTDYSPEKLDQAYETLCLWLKKVDALHSFYDLDPDAILDAFIVPQSPADFVAAHSQARRVAA